MLFWTFWTLKYRDTIENWFHTLKTVFFTFPWHSLCFFSNEGFFFNCLLYLKAKLSETCCEYTFSKSNMGTFYNKVFFPNFVLVIAKTDIEKWPILVNLFKWVCRQSKSYHTYVGCFVCNTMSVTWVCINLHCNLKCFHGMYILFVNSLMIYMFKLDI